VSTQKEKPASNPKAAKKEEPAPAAKPAASKKPLKESSAANAPKAAAKRAQSASSRAAPAPPAAAAAALKDLERERKAHGALRVTVEGLEKERDFYFDKLRDIEVMLQAFQEKEAKSPETTEGARLIKDVFKVLYATTDDRIVVNDNGELVAEAPEEEAAEGGGEVAAPAMDAGVCA
jgi:RP/EB family microtubule-associated protein